MHADAVNASNDQSSCSIRLVSAVNDVVFCAVTRLLRPKNYAAMGTNATLTLALQLHRNELDAQDIRADYAAVTMLLLPPAVASKENVCTMQHATVTRHREKSATGTHHTLKHVMASWPAPERVS